MADWDRSDLVESVGRQAAAVGDVLKQACPGGAAVPVVAVVCFVGSEWAMPAGWVMVGSVAVAEAGGLGRVLRRRGPLGRPERPHLAHVLDAALPPR